jgi:hypothetical protein
VTREVFGAVLAALAGAMLIVPCTAEAQPLDIQVTTVRALGEGPCDPQLESLRPRLRHIAGYRSYQLLGEQQRRVAWRNTEAFDVGDGRSLVLLPKGMVDQRVMMQVRLLEGRKRLLDTNVRLLNGGTMVFGVGRDARSGDDGAILILLRAQNSPQQTTSSTSP